jgi:hypothetical protein
LFSKFELEEAAVGAENAVELLLNFNPDFMLDTHIKINSNGLVWDGDLDGRCTARKK